MHYLNYINQIKELYFYTGETEIITIVKLFKINIYVFEHNEDYKYYKFLYKFENENNMTYTLILEHLYWDKIKKSGEHFQLLLLERNKFDLSKLIKFNKSNNSNIINSKNCNNNNLNNNIMNEKNAITIIDKDKNKKIESEIFNKIKNKNINTDLSNNNFNNSKNSKNSNNSLVNNNLIINSTDELKSLNLYIKCIVDSISLKFNNLLIDSISDFSKLILSKKTLWKKM